MGNIINVDFKPQNKSQYFDRIVQYILQVEGGYVFNIKDPGGETKYGISKRSFPNVDIKNLTTDDAIGIYKKEFWDKYKFEQINDYDIARKLFDATVNTGSSQAVKLIQRSLDDIIVDGLIGPKTISAINAFEDQELLLLRFLEQWISFYLLIIDKDPATHKDNLLGWVRRVYK